MHQEHRERQAALQDRLHEIHERVILHEAENENVAAQRDERDGSGKESGGER
jgi:hypothetical protein